MSRLRRLGIFSFLVLVGVLASGCSKDVTIGAIISETGSVAPYGEKVKKGMELALEEVNASGGINGGQLSIVYKDDATNPQRGVQVAEELIDSKIDVIVGAVGSPVTLAIAPICQEHEVLLFSPSASASELTGAGDYVYRNYPSDILEGTSMARFAKDLGLERMVIFALDNEFGNGLSEIFTQQYESRFREVIKVYSIPDNVDPSAFDPWVKEVAALKPDGTYIAAYQDETAALLTKLRAAGVDSVILGSSSVTADVIRLAGDAAENLVYPQSVFDLDSSDPAVAEFVRAYRAKYNEDPDTYAAHGYDAVKILAAAMREHGADPNNMRIALNGLSDYPGAAGKTVFDKNGDVIRHPRLLLIRNGVPTPYDRFVEEGGSILPAS